MKKILVLAALLSVAASQVMVAECGCRKGVKSEEDISAKEHREEQRENREARKKARKAKKEAKKHHRATEE